MKNLLKIGIAAFLVFNFSALQAKDIDFSVKVKNVNEKSVAFLIDGPQVIDLSIYSANGDLLYTQNIKTKNTSTRTYNLRELPDGTYTFKLVSELKAAEYKVIIENAQAKVSEPVVEERFKPVLTREEGVITLDLKNAPAGPVEVQILDRYNEPLYNKVFDNGLKTPKRFNVDRVFATELTFVVKSERQESRETVQMY
ncbi:T9SS type A sorting domain-containing protein [Pedobacter africanus]|uniref:Por secretion system C-terminal sorting domain-containing protein n=1 Tax=Pedobacter africanus TaxID=151894 RepID=A0A1W2ECG8_9SPHI|nr:T9SS type A sorting domain-containing protein [Pedobacter africanus]SMD07337.1 Por secretion system C-terminal sorting domain-containing protein [Pedobacter africanus]